MKYIKATERTPSDNTEDIVLRFKGKKIRLFARYNKGVFHIYGFNEYYDKYNWEFLEWLDESEPPNEPSIQEVDRWVDVKEKLPTKDDTCDEFYNEVLTLQHGRTRPTFMKYWELQHCPFTHRWMAIKPLNNTPNSQPQPLQDERVYPNEKVIGIKFEDNQK